MSMLGAPPPIDPQRDARLQARAARQRGRETSGVVCVILQPTLALVFGAWAASPLTQEFDEALPYAAVAMGFALGAAWSLVLALRFALGMLVSVVSLPRLWSRLTASPPAPLKPGTARDDRMEGVVDSASVLLHALVFIAGALLIAAVAASASDVLGFGDLAWRFALPALLLSLLTPRALSVMWWGGE